MKLAILASLLLSSAVALADIAETSTNTTYAAPTEATAKGLRLELVKSFLTGKVSGNGYSSSDTVRQDVGVAFGYASIRPLAVGFIANGQYDQLEENVNVLRANGNITYGFERMGYVFGGLNISRLNNVKRVEISPAMGFQFGVGANFTKTWGADLGYSQLNNKVSANGRSADLELTGLELHLHVTF